MKILKSNTSVLKLLFLSKMEHKEPDLLSHLKPKKERKDKYKKVFKTLDMKQQRLVISETGNQQGETSAAPADHLKRISRPQYRQGNWGRAGRTPWVNKMKLQVLGTKVAEVLRAESWRGDCYT